MTTITKDRIKPGYIPPTPIARRPILVKHGHLNFAAHDADVKGFFGLQPKDKWPDEGMPSIFIPTRAGQVQAFVISKEDASIQGRFQRCLCLCPNCSETVPLGRLNQHWAVHE